MNILQAAWDYTGIIISVIIAANIIFALATAERKDSNQ
jgi:hypothetical protein